MSTDQPFSIDTYLSSMDVVSDDSFGSESGGATGIKSPLFETGYEGKIDYRVRQLSHSARELLSSCPRLYQLNRLRTTQRTIESLETSITFSFGHVVGEGIQQVMCGKSEDEVIWAMFQMWHVDLLEEDTKRAKSFWLAVIAIQKFIQLRSSGFLDEYDVMMYQGVFACELSFRIQFPDGFNYRGSVDCVLVHRQTSKILVLELKTTGFTSVNSATYKNSGQAIGYSIVLDHLVPDLSSYEVLYLVYKTKSFEFEPITFVKSYLQRALWLRELLLDIDTIKMYEEAEVYPMRGNACVRWGRDCEYIQTCGMSTQSLMSSGTAADLDTKEYQIDVSLLDLLNTQFSKTEDIATVPILSLESAS